MNDLLEVYKELKDVQNNYNEQKESWRETTIITTTKPLKIYTIEGKWVDRKYCHRKR